jgi:hypothetical protein
LETKGEQMKRTLAVFSILLLSTGCSSRSSVTGDVVPISQVCTYEKWKTVAVEGYLAPDSIRCERVGNKRRRGIVWCALRVYQTPDHIGASLSVQIPIAGWLNGYQNHMDDPDDSGNDLRIYDNEGNVIPVAGKIRVFGQLPKSDKCEFGLATRIDRVS